MDTRKPDPKERSHAHDHRETETSTTAQRVTVAAAVSFDDALRAYEHKMEADFETNRAAERLSAEDLSIRINAKA
jgi:hypothetical protein